MSEAARHSSTRHQGDIWLSNPHAGDITRLIPLSRHCTFTAEGVSVARTLQYKVKRTSCLLQQFKMPRGASLQRALIAAAKRAGSDSSRAFSDVASTGSTMQQARGLRTMAARGAAAWSNSSANSTGLTKSAKHADGCPCTACCSMHGSGCACQRCGVQTAAELEPCPNMNIAQRHKMMLQHFPTAMGVDDFMARVEVALAGYGFTGDNAIGRLHCLPARSTRAALQLPSGRSRCTAGLWLLQGHKRWHAEGPGVHGTGRSCCAGRSQCQLLAASCQR